MYGTLLLIVIGYNYSSGGTPDLFGINLDILGLFGINLDILGLFGINLDILRLFFVFFLPFLLNSIWGGLTCLYIFRFILFLGIL